MTGSDKKELPGRVGRLLGSQRVGVLATRYQGGPHQSLIAYIGSEDLRYIFFTTPAHTRKVAAMAEDPRVTFLVDDRQNMESDFEACIAVSANGMAEMLPEQERDFFVSRFLERHPYLEEFVASPSCRCCRIRVQSYTLVSRFQKVEELLLP